MKEGFDMKVTQTRNETRSIELNVEGRLDTQTAPQLEEIVKEVSKENRKIIMDLSRVNYISSSGIRVIVLAHKIMTSLEGTFSIRNPSSFCLQVFSATGLDTMLNIVN
ncbi:MAG: STAS domain-containing protein [Treponema sp.]|nr:STAS domain-containing protein [Treponema sp.]